MALKRKKALRAPSPKVRARAAEVLARLRMGIPTPHVELHFKDPWQLLVAVILSAQSTDKMVNTVTPELWKRWPDAKALAKAPQEEVEVVVKSTGFFRNKAKAIREMSRMLSEDFGGTVPKTMDEILRLPGVARKTGNVVLGSAHRVAAGITVDTHAMRVSQRLGLTKQTEPEKIEEALCALFPRDEWIYLGHRFVLHGRHVCTAKNPRCRSCPLNELCPSVQEKPEGSWKERAAREVREMDSRADAGSFTRLSPAP